MCINYNSICIIVILNKQTFGKKNVHCLKDLKNMLSNT